MQTLKAGRSGLPGAGRSSAAASRRATEAIRARARALGHAAELVAGPGDGGGEGAIPERGRARIGALEKSDKGVHSLSFPIVRFTRPLAE